MRVCGLSTSPRSSLALLLPHVVLPNLFDVTGWSDPALLQFSSDLAFSWWLRLHPECAEVGIDGEVVGWEVRPDDLRGVVFLSTQNEYGVLFFQLIDGFDTICPTVFQLFDLYSCSRGLSSKVVFQLLCIRYGVFRFVSRGRNS